MAARPVLDETVGRIGPVDTAVERAARAAFSGKAKPPGSLGRLEELAGRVAGIRGVAVPDVPTSAVVVCAADHGVAAEGVSAYPQQVTATMVATIASGRAAVSVLARQCGARLVVADLGVRPPVRHPGVLDRRIGAGTANAAHGPAMSQTEAERSLAVGVDLAGRLADDGIDLIAIGEMGIANTTPAAALAARFLDVEPAAVCGRGTGVDDAGLARKVEVVERMLAVNPVPADDPVGVLAGVGGYEIGALAGIVLGAAARRVPVVLDGFITAAAALVAVRIVPACSGTMIAAHRSAEPGHIRVLAALGLEPVLDLGMRLGEASGAALALPVIAASIALLRDMATLAEITDG
ncbi:MAG: nicotinate-nucleotide--dimethylbenzimidazole phosphoribosyltransferase [bacterium]